MMDFTLIVPYYRNVEMLKKQVHFWKKYPVGVKILLVDDGSPEPALDAVPDMLELAPQLSVYRVCQDIPWNRNGARNLGTQQAETEWVLHVDVDHVLPVSAAVALTNMTPTPGSWYRFARYRVGKADFTRKKDAIPDDCEFGKIHPHIDSYLIERKNYLALGGYDEDYSGSLGGGTPFVHELSQTYNEILLDDPICLHVYTTDKVKDASDIFLSRDRSRYQAIAKYKYGTPRFRRRVEIIPPTPPKELSPYEARKQKILAERGGKILRKVRRPRGRPTRAEVVEQIDRPAPDNVGKTKRPMCQFEWEKQV